MSALTALSRHLPVSVVGFGNVGPGVSAGVPLRYADLSPASQAGGLTQAGYARSVRFGAERARYQLPAGQDGARGAA